MPDITATVSQEDVLTAYTSINQAAIVERMADLLDVDTTGKVTGSLLIYNSNTNKWTASTTLNAQNMEGGEF